MQIPLLLTAFVLGAGTNAGVIRGVWCIAGGFFTVT